MSIFVNGRRTSKEGKKKDNHGIENDLDRNREQGLDVHLHLPTGAQKKDGLSKGIAMVYFGVIIDRIVCSYKYSYDK